MESEERIRVVGGHKTRDVWERFDRLQSTVDLIIGGKPHPKGVFRFKTWDEFNEWKRSYRIRAANPAKTTSSPSAAH